MDSNKKDMIFFGQQGLTSTSANFVANMAKEMLRKDESRIEGISFVNEEYSTTGNPTKSQLNLGLEEAEVREVAEVMQRVIRLKSLIAWLREAIKAKDRLWEKVKSVSAMEHWTNLGNDCPSRPALLSPLTEDDYMATLSVSDRCKMLALQTKAAVLGKLLHQNGAFEKAREKMYSVKSSPRELVSRGVNNFLFYYEPSVDPEVVDEVYFQLTSQYREAQAGLNSYLHAMQAAIQKSEVETAQKNQQLLSEHEIKKEKIYQIHTEWQSKELKKISDLKIIIPASLKDIYEEVQKVGKK